MRIDIIGAGIMGLSAAWALHKRGHRIRLFEQGPIPNPLAASADRHRLIRYPYGDQDGYVRMVGQAYAAWDELWTDVGERLQIETGTLAFDTADDDWANRSRASLDRCAIPYDLLAPAELERRFPFLASETIGQALYLPSGGVLLAERILAALSRHLTGNGVELRANSKVVQIDPAHARLRLTDGGISEAELLVVAAGPWTPKLVPGLAGRVTPSRQVVSYLVPPAGYGEAWARAPMILAIGLKAGFYAVPPVAGLGLKVGDHRFSLQGDPDRERTAGGAEAAAIADQASGWFRDFAAYRLSEAKTCFYDVADGEEFIVEPIGPRCWVLSGFSGHGFKFGAILGNRLAAAIAGEIPAGALSAWAAGRGIGV